MTLQAGILPKVHDELNRWRAAGTWAAALGVLPVVLTLALWRLAVSDGGRHPATLVAVQTVVFAVCAALAASGAARGAALVRPMAALLAAAALSAFWSVRPDSSVREVLLWTTYLGIVVIVVSSLGSPRGARNLVDGILAVGGWLSLIGLYLFWGAANPRLRWYSTFYSPNAFAAFLLLMIPLALARCLMARNRREAFDYGAITVLLGTAFLLTYSRGAYLALLVGAAAGVAVLRTAGWQGVRRLVVTVAATAAAVTLLTHTPGTVVSRTAAVLDSGSSSIQDRLSFWHSAAGIFRDYPLTGSGPGTFAYVHGKYQGRYYAQDAHNLYVQTLAEMGVVGVAALAAVLGSLGAVWLRALRKARATEEYPLVAGAGISLLAFLLHSAVEMNWHFPANPAVAFALAGTLAWYDRWGVGGRDGRPRLRSGPPGGLRAAAVVLLVAGMAAVQLIRIAEVEFGRGRRLVAYRQWSGALQRFTNAAALNPLDPKAPSAQAVMVQHLSRPAEAPPLIRRAMGLDRMNAYYPLQLAETLLPAARDHTVARDVEGLLLHALELDPFHYPEGYRRLAQLYAGQGRNQDAEAVYARAAGFYGSRSIAADPILRFRLWPRVAALISEWAAFTASRRGPDEAIGVLDRLVVMDPTWQPAYRQISDLFARDGRPREAACALVAGWAERPESLAVSPRPSRLSAVFPRVYPR